MSFDYYASLAEQKICPPKVNKYGLASGFVDGCIWNFAKAEIDLAEAKQHEKKAEEKRKNEVRKCYMKRASELKGLKLPEELRFDPDFSKLPDPSWFGIKVEFELLSPWYSKDDRPFHVLDNPVRKDKVFGVPFMPASSWKGLLRWACRMEAGLFNHLETHNMEMDGWKDPPWIVHLLGNERAEGNDFSRGALQFYPTWFDKLGFEVINPHSRKTRAGTQPIYYEVVPAGTKGCLSFLYAPLPGQAERIQVKPIEAIDKLIGSLQDLFEKYGISAKRTAGWGAAEVKSCSLFFMKGSWLEESIGSDNDKEYSPPEENFKSLMDESGFPIKILLDKNKKLLSKTQFKKLADRKPGCTNTEFESFKNWYEKCGEEYKRQLNRDGDSERLPSTVKRSFDSLARLRTTRANTRKGDGQ